MYVNYFMAKFRTCSFRTIQFSQYFISYICRLRYCILTCNLARVRLNKGLRFQNVAPTKVILVHFSVHSLRCHSNFLYIDRVYALGTHFKLRIKLNFRLVQSNCLLELFARRRSVTSYCQRCFPEIRLLHTNSDVRKKSFERK